jgi:hypothetical protein
MYTSSSKGVLLLLVIIFLLLVRTLMFTSRRESPLRRFSDACGANDPRIVMWSSFYALNARRGGVFSYLLLGTIFLAL